MIAAAMSQAAAIAWQSGTIYVATDAAGTTGTGTANRANTSTRLVNMYIYALTEEQFNAASAMDTATLYDTYYKTTATGSKGTGGTGTAAVISPIGHLIYKDKDHVVSNDQIGELTQKLYDELTGIQWGRREDTRSWCVKVKV